MNLTERLDEIVLDPKDIADLRGETLSKYTMGISQAQVKLLKLMDEANDAVKDCRLVLDNAKARKKYAEMTKAPPLEILELAKEVAQEQANLIEAQNQSNRAKNLFATAKDLRIDAQSQAKNNRP